MSLCHIYELKKSLWNVGPHCLGYLLPHVDIKPLKIVEGFLTHGTKVEIDFFYIFIVQ